MRTIAILLLVCACISAAQGEELSASQQYVMDFYNFLGLPKGNKSFLDDYAKIIETVGAESRRKDFKKADGLIMQLVDEINAGVNPVPLFDLIAKTHLPDNEDHSVPDGYEGLLREYQTRESLAVYILSKCDALIEAKDDETLLKCVKAYCVLSSCEIRFRWIDFHSLLRSGAYKYIAEKHTDAFKDAWAEIAAQQKACDEFYTAEHVFLDAADKFAAKHGEAIPNEQFDAAVAEMSKFWPPPGANPEVGYDVSEWLSHLASLTKARKRPDLLEKVNALAAKWSAETHDPALSRWLSATAKARAYDGEFCGHMGMGDDGEFIGQEEYDALQARKKAAANPNAPPPPDPHAHFTGDLESADPAVRGKAAADLAKLLNSSSKATVTELCRRMGTEWGAKLAASKLNDEFLSLSKKAIALRAGNSESNEALLFLRVKVLLATGANDEALIEAKALYNFVALKNFDTATALALEALASARPGVTDLNALRSVKAYSSEYNSALEKATLGTYAESESMGNLLLLLDRPREAKNVFERAALLATAEQSTQALENVARARKALDFDPSPARTWLAKALATLPSMPPVKKKETENGAF